MAKSERFTLLCDANERRVITELALRLGRSRSDAVRYVLLAAAKDLGIVVQIANRATQPEPANDEGGHNAG